MDGKSKKIIFILAVLLVITTCAWVINLSADHTTASFSAQLLESPDETVHSITEIRRMNLQAYRSDENQYFIDRTTGKPRIFINMFPTRCGTAPDIGGTEAIRIASEKLTKLTGALFLTGNYYTEVVPSHESLYIVNIHPISSTLTEPGAIAAFHITPSGEILDYWIDYQWDTESPSAAPNISSDQAIRIAVPYARRMTAEQTPQITSGTDGQAPQECRFTQSVDDVTPRVELGFNGSQPYWMVQFGLDTSIGLDYTLWVQIDAQTGEVLSPSLS